MSYGLVKPKPKGYQPPKLVVKHYVTIDSFRKIANSSLSKSLSRFNELSGMSDSTSRS